MPLSGLIGRTWACTGTIHHLLEVNPHIVALLPPA
jgi:hypothetical protein